RKALLPLPERIRSHARIHLPGIGAVVLVSTIASCSGGLMPAGVSVALLVAAVGAGALSGGGAPAMRTGGAARPARWLLGVPFDRFFFGAFLLGGILLAMAGENAVRSRDRVGTLAAELDVMQRRLVDEADVRRRAEEAETALGRARHRFERLVRSNVVPAVVTDDGRCIDASPAFLELVGHGAEEAADGVLHLDILTVPAERPPDAPARAP